MSDTVKLVVTLNKGQYENLKNIHCGSIGARMIVNAVMNGIPLDDIKAEIEEYRSTIDRAISEDELKIEGMKEAYTDCLKILDNIGKAEKGGEEVDDDC